MTIWTSLLVLALLAANAAIAGYLAPTATTITLQAPIIVGCQETAIEIWINDVSNLYGADVRLTYDPAALYVDRIEDGTFITHNGFLLNQVNNTTGELTYASAQRDPDPVVNGSGVLAVLYVQAKQAGDIDLQFSYTKLSDPNGVEIPATPADGTVEAAPPAAPDVSISHPAATTARLQWSPVTDVAQYLIYRSTAPYFTPAPSPFATDTASPHEDNGAVGDPATNYYYVVRSACSSGMKSAISNRVGEFDFTLLPGS